MIYSEVRPATEAEINDNPSLKMDSVITGNAYVGQIPSKEEWIRIDPRNIVKRNGKFEYVRPSLRFAITDTPVDWLQQPTSFRRISKEQQRYEQYVNDAVPRNILKRIAAIYNKSEVTYTITYEPTKTTGKLVNHADNNPEVIELKRQLEDYKLSVYPDLFKDSF